MTQRITIHGRMIMTAKMMNCRRWLKALVRPRGPGNAKRQNSRKRPTLEKLEGRVTPTIIYTPQFGAEQTSDSLGPDLGDVPVYLIFWGPEWGQPANQTAATTL